MTSQRKLDANRQNARRSTGPKSIEGRRRAAGNALRHGLNVSIYRDPFSSAEVESLAAEISAEHDSDGTGAALARSLAEAEVEVRRVRRFRDNIIARLLLAFDAESPGQSMEHLARDMQRGDTHSRTQLNEAFFSNSDHSEKFTAILVSQNRTLLSLDRYERRAVSRRRAAVEDYCAWRAQQGRCSQT